LLEDTLEPCTLLLGISHTKEHLRVPLGKASPTHCLLHVNGELEEAEGVRNRGTRNANLRGNLLLREAEFLLKLLVRGGAVDGVEVLALDVLHEREFELRAVIVLTGADDNWHRRESGELRGAEPAFTGDELVRTIGPYCDDERLQNAVRSDGCREGRELLMRKLSPRLERVRVNVLHGHDERAPLIATWFWRWSARDERGESTTETVRRHRGNT